MESKAKDLGMVTGGGAVKAAIAAVAVVGREAPSTRVRVTDWFDFLGIADVDYLFHAGLGTIRVGQAWQMTPVLLAAERRVRRESQAKRQRVLLSREAGILSRGSIESAFLRNAGHSVYDFDDALFHDHVGARRAYGRPAKARRAASAADVVVAGNEYLANWAADYARDVRIIPSCVEPSQYTPKTSWDIDGPPTIVWLGSAGTEQFVEHFATELAEVHRRTAARLRIISAPRKVEHPLLAPFVDRVTWSPSAAAEALAAADVAIAPLDDSPYSRGKCAYKLLQYAAAALPIVGSPVGANQLALQRFDGLAVRTRDDWVDALVSVVEEPSEVRCRRGQTALESVQSRYSFGAWQGRWLDAMALPTR